jgi:hypothetical protein
MDEGEARNLVDRTAAHLGVKHLLTQSYIDDIVQKSEGHPYVIKILLGEVGKVNRAADIRRLIAGTDDILTALFERTYAALTPCAQRAFLTLSAWNTWVPRLALEAVLFRSTEERQEVEKGIEMLLQYSMAESRTASADEQELIGLPLVSSVFGKKKLNISPLKSAVQADVEILQLLGPSRSDEIQLGIARRLERFIGSILHNVESGASFDSFYPMLEMICRAYNPGWLILARWHMEDCDPKSYEMAKEEVRRFLENDPAPADAAEAWLTMGHICYKTRDALGEIHSFIERAQIRTVPFHDVSNTANRLNQLLRQHALGVDRDQKRSLAQRLALVLEARRGEATADDYSRMAWLQIHLDQEAKAQEYVHAGLLVDPQNYHCINLRDRLGTAPSEPREGRARPDSQPGADPWAWAGWDA